MSRLYASMIISIVVLLTACQSQSNSQTNPNRAEPQEIVTQRTAVLQEAQQKRENRNVQLKAMDVSALAQELSAESQKGTEPFNSTAFAEAVSRGPGVAASLAPLITKPDRSSLLALLAVRRVNPDRYKQVNATLRVNALVDALKTSMYFNTWGLPHIKWEEAAQAIIDEGAAAERALVPLLTDKRDAPVWGGEDFAEYQRYRYRVCDYAWALLNEIRKQRVPIPESPAERDRLQQQAARPRG